MNSRNRFLKACEQKLLDRPPVWVMRQAGRYLPEYRALKEKYSFLEMVQTPELALEVTLQPLKRFKLDAAIMFSDILVIPEALGQPYSFPEGGGIQMDYKIRDKTPLEKLSTSGINEKLAYIYETIKMIKRELDGKQALIGFGGSPWTLATYMVEGSSSRSFAHIKSMLYQEPALFHALLEKITEALIIYFKSQIEAGVDVIQIFDSWGGILSPETFWNASGRYMARIISALDKKVPIIVYSKGSHGWAQDLSRLEADVLGVDWTISIRDFYESLGRKVAVQGNLDPALMSTKPEIVKKETLRILKEMENIPGFIFNLGHGILPDAKIENMEMLVETIINYIPEQ
ncbi:MAG: uroporphyrinogen decarboxylase [Candidatus Neomarinimicrobiota bacterium]